MVLDLTSRYSVNVRWKELLRRRVPITEWLPQYNLATLAQDTLAGFTVGLTLIPQGIAYAYVAGKYKLNHRSIKQNILIYNEKIHCTSYTQVSNINVILLKKNNKNQRHLEIYSKW